MKHVRPIMIRAYGFVHAGYVGILHDVLGEGLLNGAVTIAAPEDHSIQQLEVAQPVVRVADHVLQVHSGVAMPNVAYVAGVAVYVRHSYELGG